MHNIQIQENNIYKKIMNDAFIYKAIYSLESSINEKNLLSNQDYLMLLSLRDSYNSKIFNKVITDVKQKLHCVLVEGEFFYSKVYFRPKKMEEGRIIYRPLHSTDLITMISSIVLLNVLLFDFDEEYTSFELNEIAKMLPDNFYGNIPSSKVNQLFMPWYHQYKKYVSNATEKYKEFLKTQEYRYEVTLDLIDFFPSINPILVYEELSKKIICDSNDDSELINTILIKLLSFKVDNLNNEELELYYGVMNENLFKDKFVKGIPQGLPHAYFFGNICMISISKIFNKYLEGLSYYYVDDSVIYTNLLLNEGNFESKINDINLELSQINNIYSKDSKNRSDLINFALENEFFNYFKEFDFKLKVHDDKSVKSYFVEIQNSKAGQATLNTYTKLASMTSYDINKLFSDSEEENLTNRLKALYDSIEVIINEVKSDDKFGQTNYFKTLVRYKKFFKYRQLLLKFRNDNQIDREKVIKFLEKIVVKSQESKNSFFEFYNEDIMINELMFYSENYQDFHSETKKELVEFSKGTYIYNYRNSYFYKFINSLEFQRKKKDSLQANKYSTISKIVVSNLPNMNNVTKELKVKKIRESLNLFYDYYRSGYNPEELADGDLKRILKELEIFNMNNKYKLVQKKSQELIRILMNAYFSVVIQVEINDKYSLFKKNIKPIQNNEARFLFYLRNSNFDMNDFVDRFIDFTNKEEFDYSLLNVIDYFAKHIVNPNMIDDLILIHKYTSDIWKNGSKFLHFYTLHNQEHAIEIIKSIIMFTRSISYFQITKLDYYILFISCYLHDISMVLHPNLIESFVNDRNQSDLVTTKFKDKFIDLLKLDSDNKYLMNLENIDSRILKGVLVEYFTKLDQFYEMHVRDGHPKDSANFILKSNDLSFIDATIRDIVAEVSRSHGYSTDEIYNSKSKAKDRIVSEKYLKILLRIGDLMDLSSNRITNVILNNNHKNMSNITRFHWLSHKAISSVDIKVEYVPTLFSNKKELSKIQEHISFIIKLNTNHFINTNRNITCREIPMLNISRNCCDNKIEFEINKVGSNSCRDCNFMCKWMLNKNYYLHNELSSLKHYFDKLNDDLFESKLFIIYEFESDAKKLSNSDYQSINDYLELR